MDPFPLTPRDIDLRRDLIGRGWRDRDIAAAVRAGTLTKVRYGAYVRSELVASLDEAALARVRARAVLRTGSAASVLSHDTAYLEHGLPAWGLDLDNTHLTRTDGKAGRREAGVVQHRNHLRPHDWQTRDGVQLTSPARAVLEVIVRNPSEVGLVAASSALAAGTVGMDELRAWESDAERWPHSLNVRMVLARADRRLASVAEARCWHLFHEQRVPLPEPQVAVYDERGQLLGIVDFLWRELGVFLEFDGLAKYLHHRRLGESLDEYLMREKRRQELICQVTGWTPIRIQWIDLEHPVRTARRIMAILEKRSNPAA